MFPLFLQRWKQPVAVFPVNGGPYSTKYNQNILCEKQEVKVASINRKHGMLKPIRSQSKQHCFKSVLKAGHAKFATFPRAHNHVVAAVEVGLYKTGSKHKRFVQ